MDSDDISNTSLTYFLHLLANEEIDDAGSIWKNLIFIPFPI